MNKKDDRIRKIHNQPEIDDIICIENKKKIAESWFLTLRDEICKEFINLELDFLGNNNQKNLKVKDIPQFVKKNWRRDGGGGGTMSVMKGSLFEKVGVNVSTVHGIFSNEFKSQIPGAEKTGKFWASGISIVSHMTNPKIPAAHLNTRLLVTGEGRFIKTWFGGGCDLTPMIPDQKAKQYFHKELRSMCNKHSTNYYDEFRKWCDDYFYLPHRKETRGVGGIFFDYLNNLNWQKDLNFVKDVGKTFLKSYKEIIKNRMFLNFTQEDKRNQLLRRGRYVEFNLLYDRGTIFGLKTQGNTEAILMSLPPVVSWS